MSFSLEIRMRRPDSTLAIQVFPMANMLGQFRSDGYLIVRFDRLRMSGGSEEGFVTDLKMYEIYDHAWGLNHFKDSEGKTLQDAILNTPIGPLDIKWCSWCHIEHTEIYCFEIYTEEEYRRLKRLKRLKF